MSGCCEHGGCGCHPEGLVKAESPVSAEAWIQDDHYFAMARLASKNSTCAKTHTGAAIVKDGKLIARSCNLCSPEGKQYYKLVEKCPREGMKTGTGYELCKPVHAEVMACLNAKVMVSQHALTQEVLEKFAGHLKPSEEEILAAFTPEEMKVLNGAICYLAGHYWACENCINFLKAVGITDIRLAPTTAKETKEKYQAKGITKEQSEPPPGSD